MDLVMELDNVTIVNNNHPQVQWSVDTTTFFKSQFDRYVILREDVAWAPVGFVYDVDKLYYDNLSANDVTNTVYNYRVYMEYNSFNMDTTREVHSIVLDSEGDCDTLCLSWNSYNGWDSATYDIFVEDGNLGWFKLNSLPITDTVYCGNFDTLAVGFNLIKVLTTNGIDTSESNYRMCNQPAPPEVAVPNVLTPNNDGVNDIFIIDYINLYDARELTVFNRWGTPVYQSSDYQNDWDGGNLAGGVYFYVLDLWKGSVGNHYYGTVTIIR